MTIEEKLATLISDVLKVQYDIQLDNVPVEIPRNTEFGDYATTVAMQLAKQLKRAPRQIAEELKPELEKTDWVETVEIAGPGYLNFRLKKDSLAEVITRVLDAGDKYGNNYSGKRQSILVEYVSANPTGDLHLGHARGAVWGDAICRLLKASNYDVLREYYINDAGAQMTNLGLSVYARYAQYFGRDVEIPEDGYMADDVKEIGERLAKELGDVWLDKEEGRTEFFKEQGYKEELKKIEEVLRDFRVEFDSWVSEQWLYDTGLVQDAIDRMNDLGVIYEQDGALWLQTTKWGDDKDRVLRKANGLLTYMTPDIANHLYKFDRGYTKLVNLWGADHHGYINRMKAALMAFGYERDDLEVDIIQMVHLVENGEEVKMSKRTGNAVTIRELIDDVGVDAARYFFVSRAVEAQMDFDLGLARSHSNENPIYYIQYAHARACGILDHAPEYHAPKSFSHLTSDKANVLLKLMDSFPDLVAEAAKLRAPNKIANFLMQLATAFHSYYAETKIVDEDDREGTNERVGLVLATKTVLHNALALIGVSAPEQM
ncbi:MAG: arginine--tRNA ligase [Peptoniphilaceae bacterium]|nr:arginine--tRNA ligase [Peptoniphilaceae bacterium]MDY6085523.1 arginine--tRNA ligase [Peptoniphilaceae bacterium]